MKLKQNYWGNYTLLVYSFLFYLVSSLLLRFGFLAVSFQKADLSLLPIMKIFLLGFLFDFGVGLFFLLPYSFYLLIFPQKYIRSLFNKIITYSTFIIFLLIHLFSFFAEVTFWQEFESRFNFIAVDYLVYTYEVINNINESYPLPVLISSILLLMTLIFILFYKSKIFFFSFNGQHKFSVRLIVFLGFFCLTIIYSLFISNSLADKSVNRYQNEISKAGIYSFFSAYKNNEINYDHFYKLIDNESAFKIVRTDLNDNQRFFSNNLSIERKISSKQNLIKPNVLMITMESFSADFMGTFGNKQGLTPNLDSLAGGGILFSQMYATGTRTVRGMEALSLAVPPTPGNSIVRREDNDHLTTIGSIFSAQGYDNTFIYGGDGYFDNMNKYFGNNGYDIIDKKRNPLAKENYQALRTPINQKEITFENAWGICDEDLYNQVIKQADQKYKQGKSFYDFVMTTSNHRPFTYPDGKIDIPSGSGREGAIKYTDYAIGQFFKKARSKPWFKNTVFVIVADHCASSAGKNEIDISKYHIPAMIINLPNQNSLKIEKMCSQIDLYPTLFDLMGWNYRSNLYGKNVLSDNYIPRIFVSTYQKLGYMENDKLVILSPQQKVEAYLYNKTQNQQIPKIFSDQYINKAVANYQTAYYLYKNQGLKQK